MAGAAPYRPGNNSGSFGRVHFGSEKASKWLNLWETLWKCDS